jgi:uncharacterized SAM-binding protein YcdF (DUF218 family)
MDFAFGKIAWIILKPSSLLFLALALGLVLRLLGSRGVARAFFGIALAGFFSCAVLPIGAWLLAPLENRFAVAEPPAKVDGVIVLGGAIEPALSADRKQVALNANAERLVALSALARRYPEAKIVFSGGNGSLGEPVPREADWLGAFLDDVGIARTRVITERNSRTTRENATMTKELVKPDANDTWLLVTSARHMPRSVGAFRHVGWTVHAYPVDFLTRRSVGFGIGLDFAGGLAALDAAAYEWCGLAYYYLKGSIGSVFPGPSQ